MGSPGRHLVSPSFQTSRSRSPSLLSSPYGRGNYSENQVSPDRFIPSPFEKRESFDSNPLSVGDTPHSSPVQKRRIQFTKPDDVPRLNLKNEIPYSVQRYVDHNASMTKPQSIPRNSKPQKMTENQLNNFREEYVRKKSQRRQYPVSLIGSDKKANFIENEQFDSDYESHQSSMRNSMPDRKNVQFNKNINYFSQYR